MSVSFQTAKRRSANPYRFARHAAFAASFAGLVFGVMYIRLDSTTYDLWQHLAAIRTLSANLLNPPPLFLDEAYEVHLYTPYHVFWAAVMALGQLDIWNVLTVSSIVNILLFMIGCHLLAHRVIGNGSLDFALFATLLLFWGSPPWWSGIYSLSQIVLVITYPSMFAFSVAMIIGAIYFEPGFRGRAWQAGFAAVLAILFVIHPITTSFLLVFLAVKVLMSPGIDTRGVLLSAWPPTVGISLGFFWPYFSVPELVLSARSTPNFFGSFYAFYSKPLQQIGPAILGIAALTTYRSSRPIRFLLVLLAVMLAIYTANYVFHISHILSRYLIYIAFILQLLLVAWVASFPERKTRAVLLGGLFAFGIAAGAIQVQVGGPRIYGPYWDLVKGVPLGTHSVARSYSDLEILGSAIPESSAIVMAPANWTYPLAALLGVRVVAMIYDPPTVPNGDARRIDVMRFYSAATTCAERDIILRRRDADYVLLVTREDDGLAIDACSWREASRHGRFVLYAAKPEIRS